MTQTNINEVVSKVNSMLKPLELPSFRKNVTKSGRNVSWLLRNIRTRNNVDDNLIGMLKTIIGR